MRIACVHIPQFALQCATRLDPSLRLRESAVVVVGPAAVAASAKPTAPIVLACSRAAYALGARVGMTATAARGLSPLIAIVTADAQLERDTVRAIADVLLALTPVVDVGGRVGPGGAHLALYCEVPAKTRGTSYGDRLLERLEALGLTGRIGIADDRFTAWVAAWLGAWDAHDRASTAPAPARHDETGVVSVPRGGSAAFLAPRPLSLLSISPEVQHMLEALGVRTLGEFAALPSPTVSSRAARFEADYQALARGESGNTLRPYAPDAPIREETLLGAAPVHTEGDRPHAQPLHAQAPLQPPVTMQSASSAPFATVGLSAPAAVALLAERVAMRLAGRARCAARLDITIGGELGERVVTIAPVREGQGVLATAEQLADAIGSALGEDSAQAWRLRVVVSGEALAGDTAELSTDALETPAQRMFAVARSAPVTSTASSATFGSASTVANTSGRRDPRAATASAASSTFTPLSDPDVALSIALSTTGGAVDRVFGLTSPISTALSAAAEAGTAERRESHRRTRRGKQRRRAEVASMVQARLFKM